MVTLLQCPMCDTAAELRTYELTSHVQVWVCPAGHGAIQRVLPVGHPRSPLMADGSGGSFSR